MKSIFLNIITKIILFVILTVITQIGGIVYFFSLLISKKCKKNYNTLIIFLLLYFLSTLLIVPNIASVFGREPVIHSKKIKPVNYLTVILNRNYVVPELNNLLKKTEKELTKTDLHIHYLDANFPFFNNFPLLPHLSHNDGKKIDISFIYETKFGFVSDKQKTISGYGFFEAPRLDEYNQTKKCLQGGEFKYNLTRFFTFGKINQDLLFSVKGTRRIIKEILKSKNVQKIFIEPHLKTRMKLDNTKIRFQGCKSVRHDDHIHLQIK